MKTIYTVQVKQTKQWTFYIEAESEKQAKQKALTDYEGQTCHTLPAHAEVLDP